MPAAPGTGITSKFTGSDQPSAGGGGDGRVLDRSAIQVQVAATASIAAKSNIAGPTLPSTNINAIKPAA
jgi:predicted glycosyltransferase